MIEYNWDLKHELIVEMQGVSQQFRPDGLHWLWPEAERYHKLMYDVLSSMVNFPTAISEEINE